ncbi:glycosyltransferase [Arthrobacter sp. AET 35A]|uniref:glycosyltransferase n=1 Tax=Arthrobacter sp. AET 35A TaxID=2292643 RepID=UPI001CE33FBA|nr:glycosyltransferase [Arthrobacter sp. AET 35A]
MQPSSPSRTGYILKIYPRFSETFIVTEILAREAAGDELEIFSLRPPIDPRFHPELARVQAPVTYVSKPAKLAEGWAIIAAAEGVIPDFADRFARLLPQLAALDPVEVHQGVELAMLLCQRGITHVHAHFGSIAARTAKVAAELTGIAFSFTAHAKDIFHEEVDTEVLRSLIGAAHHVVTVSDFNLSYLGGLFPEHLGRVHRVYNGLELERFPFASPTAPGPVLRVAAVGRLVEKKGFNQLLEAVAELVHRGVVLDVRIAGGGELHDQLADQITRHGLGTTVTLLGPRTQAEVIDLLRWADVFAAPCLVGQDGNADGLPTVLLEAMAMGVPCIASDVTGIPEVISNGGGALDPSTPTGDGARTGILIRSGVHSDLVDALQQVASVDFDRQAVALAARRVIEQFFDSHRQSVRLQELEAGLQPVRQIEEAVAYS